MVKKYLSFILIQLFVFTFAQGQNRPSFFKVIPPSDPSLPHWVIKMYSANPNVKEVVFEYEQYYSTHPFKKNIHTQNYKHWLKSTANLIDKDGYIDLRLIERNHVHAINSERKRQQAGQRNTWSCIGPFETYNNNSEGGFPVSWQANVYCLDQSALNPDILYAGTEAGGIYKTTDRALTWFPLAQDMPFSTVNDIKIADSNDSIVFVTAEDYVYKSTDGGSTWTSVYYLTDRGNQIEINKTNPDIVLVASDAGLFRTADGGTNWSQIFTDQCWDLENHPLDSQIVYLTKKNAAMKRSEFYKSTDAGLSWTLKTNGWFTPSVPADASDIGSRIAVTSASPDMVYVALIGEGKADDNGWIGVYRSTNGGESWQNPNLPDGGPYNTVTHQNLATINLDGTGFHQGFFNFAIAVSQSDPGKLWVGCLALSVSTDSAASWTRIGAYNAGSNDIGWIHPDIQDLLAGNNEVWLACDGGVNYSNDDFQTHESRKQGLSGSDYWGFGQGWNEDVMVGGRYHNGNSGYYQAYGTGNTLRLGGAESPTGYVNPLEERKAYFSDISSKILPETINGTVQSAGNLGLYPNESYWESYSSELEFHPAYAHHMFIGKDGSIWKSVNEGSQFDELYDFGSNDRVLEIEVSLSNPNVMYCVVQPGGGYWNNCYIYRSSDAGISWAPTSLPPTSMWRVDISINPSDPDELWLSSVDGDNAYKVFNTINGGQTWLNKTTSMLDDESPVDIYYQAGTNEVVYLATTTGFFYWDVNTSDWVTYANDLPLMTRALEMKPFYKEGKLRLATTGKGIWECAFASPSLPVAQPMTETDTVYCVRDTIQLDCHSVLNHTGAQWLWTISPSPDYISSPTIRNPKVLLGDEGSYDVTLSVTDALGNTSTKTINNMITVINNCNPDTVPGLDLECVNTGDYAITPDLNVKTNTFTISAWVKPNGIQSSYSAIVINNDVSAGFNFRDNNMLGYHWPGGAWWWNSNLTVEQGVWSHVAMVVYPDSILLYCNGRSAKHNVSADSVDVGTMSIGSYKGWGSRNYKGEIDEVCIWNRSLTKDEIRQIRHLTLEDFIAGDSTVLAYYQFNETSGLILDRKGVNHAKITGFAYRDISSGPFGKGTYEYMNILSSGIYNYSNVGLKMEFPSSGSVPQGDVAVTRINLEPYAMPGSNPHTGCYWIVNNYGSNSNFTALTELNLETAYGEATSQILANPSYAVLYSRPENSDSLNWLNHCGATSVSNIPNPSFNFGNSCNIVNTGQFFVQSGDPSIELIDNGLLTENQNINLEKLRYSFYPNPVLQGRILNLQNNVGNLRLRIISSDGKLAKEIIMNEAGRYLVETGSLSPGFYQLVLESGQTIEVRKLIVQ